MLNPYLLDTSIIVMCLRNKLSFDHLLSTYGGSDITSSMVCLAELYSGVFKSARKEENEQKVLEFFSGLDEVFGLDVTVVKKFGEIKNQLEKAGNNIEDFDLLIAATCLAHGCVLITLNTKHFERVPNLATVTPKLPSLSYAQRTRFGRV